MHTSSSNTSSNWLVLLASFVIIVAGMKIASPIVVPVLLSLFIATISAPPLLWLKDKGLPTLVALLIVVAFILGIGVLLVTIIGASISEFQTQQPIYQLRLEKLFADTYALAVEKGALLGLSMDAINLSSAINPAAIAAAGGRVINEIGSLIANGFLIFITVVFILLEVSTLPGKLEKLFAQSNQSIERLTQFKRSLQHYLVIKTATSLATAAAVWMLLKVIGVDFAILWAVFAFFLNFVPNIGSIIAAVPAVITAILQLGLGAGVSVIIGYLVINSLIGTVIEPRIAGRQLGLSPLVVFLSLLFWGWILGPVGMFLSVPLTMMVRLVSESSENTRWLAIILSDRAP